MDAYSADRADLHYSGEPPIILVGDTPQALERGRMAIDAAGHRIGAALSPSEAAERLELQGSMSALWIELSGELGKEAEALLDVVSTNVRNGHYSAILAAPAILIDPLYARFDDDGSEILIDAGEAERSAALALALSGAGRADRLSDAASDKSAARLRQLSEEVNRIASTLARLSSGPGAAPPSAVPAVAQDAPEIAADTVRAVIRARRLRARYFPEDLFADPAWDMLLDLLQAEIAQLRVPVSSLCIAAAVPATTALRWLKTLVQQGLFVRRADPHDGRRVFVELAPATSNALRRYFAEVGRPAVI
jgi:hypothetical protein